MSFLRACLERQGKKNKKIVVEVMRLLEDLIESCEDNPLPELNEKLKLQNLMNKVYFLSIKFILI